MLSSFKEFFFEFVYIFKYICPVRHRNAQIRMTIDVTQKFFIYLLPWRQLWWVLKREPCISVIKHVCVFVYVYVFMYMCVWVGMITIYKTLFNWFCKYTHFLNSHMPEVQVHEVIQNPVSNSSSSFSSTFFPNVTCSYFSSRLYI
jgi:hypothetical protein